MYWSKKSREELVKLEKIHIDEVPIDIDHICNGHVTDIDQSLSLRSIRATSSIFKLKNPVWAT